MSKSLQELAKDALQVQDACNLWGVINGFNRAMDSLDKLTNGTTERDNHPICKLWADKIAHLTGTQSIGNDSVMAAYTECHKLADG